MPRGTGRRTPDTGHHLAADTDSPAVALNARATAALLGVHERTIRRAIKRGDLHAVKRSGVFLISRAEIDRFRSERRRRGVPRVAAAAGSARLSVITWSGRSQLKTSTPELVRGPRERRPAARLPLPLTSLVGRTAEIDETRDALLDRDVRLLTLTGPGGVGKTRLALHAIADLGSAFPDGVVFVPLAALRDHDLVAATVARSIGLQETHWASAAERLLGHLRDREVLLLLDSFEHLLPAGPLLIEWLTAAPLVRILVTSRARLGLSGEHALSVPTLGLPTAGAQVRAEDVWGHPATRLFAERARAVDHDFTVTDENAPHIVTICRRLDGLPLAIELAAARSPALPLRSLLARLDLGLTFLAGGPRDLPKRQRTMRDTLAWSHELLSAEEQRLFHHLAIFADGFTHDAAERVVRYASRVVSYHERPTPDARHTTHDSVLDGIEALVGHSLLTVEADAVGEPRYGMLDTIREYGLERLALSGDEDMVRDAHATAFLAFAEQAEPHLIGPDQGIWLDRLEVEHANLRAAFDWLLTRDGEAALRLAAALWRFWDTRGYLSEVRDWLARALAKGPGQASTVRARVLFGAGTLALSQTDFAAAAALLEESLAMCRHLGDTPGIGAALGRLGKVFHWQGETDRAAACYEESLSLRREVGDVREIAMALSGLGLLRRDDGDLVAAAAYVEEALALLRGRANDEEIAYALKELGIVVLAQGNQPWAVALLDEALTLFRQLDDGEGTIHCLEAIAAMVGAGRATERAARLYGAAAALRTASGVPMPPVARTTHERGVADARGELDDAAFAAAWQAGEAMSMTEATGEAAEALEELAGAAHVLPGRSAAPDHLELTPRELDVLRLLVEGKTNPEIAQELYIGRQTVATHVSHILAKLGVETRAAAAARGVQFELV